MEIELPSKLRKTLEREAAEARISLHAHVIKKLEQVTPSVEYVKPEVIKNRFPELVSFLNRIPAVTVLSSDVGPQTYWWVKLSIDIDHPLAWSVVQALGFVFNEISISERLPTLFMPVSPPPYLNGGPRDYLSWVVESRFSYVDPAWIALVLKERLPSPVEDETAWRFNDE